MSSSANAMPPSPITRFSRKDASHGAFYAGVAKGMLCALDGIQLFLTSKKLHATFWDLMKPVRNAQIAYFSIGVLIFLVVRDPADEWSEVFFTISRWSHIITVITTLILEKGYKADKSMFFAALEQKNPALAKSLEQKKVESSMKEKLAKGRRVAKMTMFKAAGFIIHKTIPATRHISIPVLKFMSLRAVLGNPVAAAVATVDAIPADILKTWVVDDILIAFSEAVIDADEMAHDMTKQYRKRMDSDEMKSYFVERFRGYLVGCGFVFSVLCTIPFAGVPMILISECASACLVNDIIERNLKKEHRQPLEGEQFVIAKRE